MVRRTEFSMHGLHYSGHIPAVMELLKLTLPSDLKDKEIDACEIPRNPTEWSRITPETAQMLYSAIALAVKQEVIQQIHFAPPTKMTKRKDDNPRVVCHLVTCSICL